MTILLCLPLCVWAQQGEIGIFGCNIRANKLKVSKTDCCVEVRFMLNLDSLQLKSNRFIHLTPALINGDSVFALTPLTIAGRRQNIVHQRNREDSFWVRRNNDKKQTFNYLDTAPYKEWMNGSRLELAQDLCGCGGTLLDQDMIPLKEVFFEVPVYHVQPVLAFIAPKVEAVKHREESGRAFLDFPVNQTKIYPDYRNNHTELEKIRATIDLVRNDSNTHITHISIHGYASPEGSYANNRRLAQGRAEALKQYVRGQYNFDNRIFSVQSTPEDWEGLKRQITESDLEKREEVLEIVSLDMEEDAKNFRLQQIDNRKTYDYLLQHIYPSLRHSDYTVAYTVRAFDVKEAKRLLHTRPQLLSLDEMFRIAATYEIGSPEFKEVFDIAVRLFPDDETANLNAALVAVSEQNYPRAGRYLEKAGDTPEAIHAYGVFYMMTGQYEEAEKFLVQAKKAGVTQANENLKQLYLKIENEKQIQDN
ncbi:MULTISPECIES: DUF3868 domain-containing protein [Bacteroidaceae]|uniref:DUF3868 domain-containing protein n=1 Tax=Bacteroidaceae TaxID=815 RepID=UPI001486111C|nr:MULTISPECIES: DUF3868 domain-containing protein [Bacteroidaceae]MCE9352628.1 DUF3868 domain-containing protein [Phocaeicola vulgatus]MDC7979738.1 DUF3868 domain-containing protein [Bacteroides faecis]